MTLSVIFARNHSNVIGVDQKLPWSFQEDMKWFKQHTDGNSIIMGHKTFHSLDNVPLPKRTNIVLSKEKIIGRHANEFTELSYAQSLPEALQYLKDVHSDKDVFIIGGAGLIKEAIPLVDRIIMTTVGMSIDESKHREVTKLDIKGLEGYYNDFMTVDGVPFKTAGGHIRSLPNRFDYFTYHVHFTVHERVR